MKNMHGAKLQSTRDTLLQIVDQIDDQAAQLRSALKSGAHPDTVYRINDTLHTLLRREDTIVQRAKKQGIHLKELYAREDGQQKERAQA